MSSSDNQRPSPKPKPKPEPKPKPAPVPAPKPLPAGEARSDPRQDHGGWGRLRYPEFIPATGNRGAVRAATSLSDLEWLTVAREDRLLYGVDLERAFLNGGSQDNAQAERAALVWRVPENDDFLNPDNSSKSEAHFAYSSLMANFSRSLIVGASLELWSRSSAHRPRRSGRSGRRRAACTRRCICRGRGFIRGPACC